MFYVNASTLLLYFNGSMPYRHHIIINIGRLLNCRSVNLKTFTRFLFLRIAIEEMSYWDGHNDGTPAPWQCNALILTPIQVMLIVFSKLNKYNFFTEQTLSPGIEPRSFD